MLVLTKREVEKKSLESLFNNCGTFTIKEKRVFCTGRYKESIIGSQVVDLPGVKYVFGEKRYSSDGSYVKLYCI
jgi:hypothetical protein